MKLDEVSSPVLAKKFSTPDFSPEEYVKTVLAKCDIYRTLYDQRNNIQKLGEETAVSLKKNVYRNYRQFIDTAKEISYLEAEMYQLSHMLTEQKATLSDQIETDIFERPKGLPVKIDSELKADETKIQQFLDNIKASKQLLDELSVKELLFDGELTEFDPETYSPIQTIAGNLLTDTFIITTHSTGGKAAILSMLDLSDLAVVNVRDGQGVKNAFKVLFSLETRMFGAPSKDLKLAWLDEIERAKKNYKKGVQVESEKLEALKRKQREEKEAKAKKKQESEEQKNEIIKPTIPVESPNKYPNLLNVDWLIELPEDLDMCIAQRDFEGAVQLVEKGRAYLVDFSESPALKEIHTKIESRCQQLVAALEKSLDNSSSSRHVSLRSIRQYVLLLIRLEREKLASDLFLSNRGYEIKNSFKQLKMEGATAIFINKLASVFFTAIIETGREYKKNFPYNKHASAFIVWAHSELLQFAEKFSRQVFTRNSSLDSVSVCISIALKQCRRLECIGIDLSFDLQQMFLKDVMSAMFDTRDHLLERSKLRTMEDPWSELSLSDENEHYQELLDGISTLGLPSIEVYKKGDRIMLSSSTLHFVHGVLKFAENGTQLYSSELHDVFTQCLSEMYKAQTIMFESLLKDTSLKQHVGFILINAEFIYGKVLSAISKKLLNLVGQRLAWIKTAEEDIHRLRKLGPGQTNL